jgi:flagellar basal-body rod modification protein FlgD
MTTTTGVGTSTGATDTTTATINSSLASVADNYQTFLSLLTTQLKNQDPLSPLDTNQFTQQLTQMTGVEQQLLSNQLLQQLVTAQAGLGTSANLIGKVISAPGANTGDPAISGVVSSVQQTNGQTMLTVSTGSGTTSTVALSAVTSVAANPNNPLSGLLGS